ncbi:MAG: fumarylacetoacetate hydrolase family protein [Bacilli bacterium]
MRIVSFAADNGVRPGIVRDDQVLDVGDVFSSVMEIVEGGDGALQKLFDQLHGVCSWRSLSDLTLLAPIPEPRRNVFCVGWNFMDHYVEGVGKRKELERDLPEYPAFFTKSTLSVNGPFSVVPYDPVFSDNIDYEGELAVVIGRKGIDIAEAQALDYVFGYMAANDISARDVQRRHGGQWFKGKAMDGSAPMGPELVTKDEVADVQNLDLECRLNGELMQSSNTKRMIFTVARQIAELSRGMTLLPGDILLTGTPDGVGWLRTPPVFLRAGDVVEVSVQHVGRIANRIALKIHD